MSKIKLKFPVNHDDKTISELTLRRPNVRDHIYLDHQKAAMKREGKVLDEVEKDAMMYARLADVDDAVIHKLDMVDWGKCRKFYLDCLKDSKDSTQKIEIN
ncbi:hypothetical protein VPPG_00051 [Vibrio phage VD1]|nr:hypothetical protein VPPG_00051 [Vibrio phage VD1]